MAKGVTFEHCCGLIAAAVLVLRPALVSRAAIVVEGVSDKHDAVGAVTFRVLSETGYVYESLLDDAIIPEDEWVTIHKPGYHQVDVSRTNTVSGGSVETLRVRISILDAERGDSDRGLFPWLPLPPLESSSNECLSARLTLVTPPRYPAELILPVVGIAETDDGQWKRLNGRASVEGFPGDDMALLRGVGHVLLQGQTTGAVLNAAVRLKPLATNLNVVIEGTTVWTTVSGVVASDMVWPTNSRIHVAGDLQVGAGATLRIREGCVVKVGAQVNVDVEGHLDIAGSLERPVVFVPENYGSPWGGFILTDPGASVVVNGAVFTRWGASANMLNGTPYNAHRDEQPLFLMDQVTAAFTNVFAVDSPGQFWRGVNADVTMTRCLVQRCVTVGQFNGGSINARNCAFVEFPARNDEFIDFDNDAIYLSSGRLTLTDSLIGWAKDDGIDAGSGGAGTVLVERCWIEGCFHEGMALSTDSQEKWIYIRDTVGVNNGQAFECGHNHPYVDLTRSLASGNEIGIRFGENYANWNFDGFLTATNTISIFNAKDLWVFDFGTWTARYDQTLVVSNRFSQGQDAYPRNVLWSPAEDAHLLEPFVNRATTTTVVCVAFPRAVWASEEWEAAPDLAVALSMFSRVPVSVDYAVAGGTAVAGEDYLLTNGTLTFMPGEIRKRIPLQVIDDGEFEVDETVRIVLSNPVAAELVAAQASQVFTIRINDVAVPDVYYVRAGNQDAAVPYTSWRTAAATIQDAAAEAAPGKLVLVTNGLYTLPGEIALTRAMTIRSVNGPGLTTVRATGAFRCFDLSHAGARVDGFTLTGGNPGGDGGGARVTAGLLQNCIVSNNACGDDGGGVHCGGGRVENCLIVGNQAADKGGGIYLTGGGVVQHCTVVFNHATRRGGGVRVYRAGTYLNTIAYDNTSDDAYDNWNAENAGGAYYNCCSYPEISLANAPAATGFDARDNITNAPAFVDAGRRDFLLQSGSACIDAGTNQTTVGTDLVGVPRPLDGDANGVARADIGAFEFIHPVGDTDQDGLTDADEIVAGTNPLDASDYLRILDLRVAESSGGLSQVSWPSVAGRTYTVLSATNLLVPAWMPLLEVPGNGESLTFTNATHTRAYYRIGVR